MYNAFMDIIAILQTKPVLIGLHLGFAIIGIDAFLWLLGGVKANTGSSGRRLTMALIGSLGYVLTWIIGGYYYVKFYGPLVKPIIKVGSAPWAHAIAMETKEHVFLFALPIAITICFLARLDAKELQMFGFGKRFIHIIIIITALGFSIGLMGFIVSAAARWGIIS